MPTALSHDLLLSLLTRAANQEFGTIIELDPKDKTAYVNGIAEVRKAYGVPAHETIMVAQPARFPNELWLVKKTVELDP